MCQSLGFLGFLGRLVKTLHAFFAHEGLGFVLLPCEHLRLLPDEVPSPKPDSESARGCMGASESDIGGGGGGQESRYSVKPEHVYSAWHETRREQRNFRQRDHVMEERIAHDPRAGIYAFQIIQIILHNR